MPRPARATRQFLAEHYAYEIDMLRGAYAGLAHSRNRFTANAMIETFALHARALTDFYCREGRRDDAAARHFTVDGIFPDTKTAGLPPDLRPRLNKQIAHLTYARGTNKIGPNDRALLLAAIEADHSAFRLRLAPDFAGCLAGTLW